jgi:hypothetical protein
MSSLLVMLLAATPGLAALVIEGLVWLVARLRRRRPLTPPAA